MFVQPTVLLNDWAPMDTAPRDGRKVLLRIRHYNWRYEHGVCWQQDVVAEWIDRNGGGWTWHGIMGEPIGWKDAGP